jgi:four helix bundle protein
MNYQSWEESFPEIIKKDSVWKMKAYRLAMFAVDIGWHDTTKLTQDKRTEDLSSQLNRALGSVSANLEEGYSRSSGKDRARFYAYALSSARESRGWYYKGRHILGVAVIEHRLQLFAEIIALLLTMIPQQRQSQTILRETATQYSLDPQKDEKTDVDWEKLARLLNQVPMPT